MADIDIDHFREHESRTEEPTDENIPVTPVTQEDQLGNQNSSMKHHLEAMRSHKADEKSFAKNT